MPIRGTMDSQFYVDGSALLADIKRLRLSDSGSHV